MLSRRVEIDGSSAGDNNETVSLAILLNPRLERQMPDVGRQVTRCGRGASSYLPRLNCSGLVGTQVDPKGRTSGRIVLGNEATAVGVDDRAADRQPHA